MGLAVGGIYYMEEDVNIGLAIYGFSELISIIDAVSSANGINEDLLARTHAHMINIPVGDQNLGLDMAPYKDGVKVAMTLDF